MPEGPGCVLICDRRIGRDERHVGLRVEIGRLFSLMWMVAMVIAHGLLAAWPLAGKMRL